MKKKFIKTPLVGVQVHCAKDVGTRTVNLLMGEHAGEYVRGDIMDANAVIQAFDEIKGSVDTDHDSLEEVVDEIHNLRDDTDQNFEVFQEKVEEEITNRTQGDNALDEKINTEKQERVNADTQLRNDLITETNRAKASENTLASNIQAEATKRENDDNTIKDNLNAEVTRATAKENEIKAEVDVINGDSTTEGSFRKAIADVVGAAPEDLDTLKEIADKLAGNDDLHTALNQAITEKADASALANEVSRATGAESGLQAAIATKADATALSNYVLTTALNKQVDTLNAAISAKQDAGNYIPYNAMVEGSYQIDKVLDILTDNGTAKFGPQTCIVIQSNNGAILRVQPTSLYGKNGDTAIDISAGGISLTDDDSVIRLSSSGVTLPYGDNNRVLTSNGSTINIGEYATQSDLSAQLSSKANRSDLTALEQKITANTTALEGKQDKGNYVTYDNYDGHMYTLNGELMLGEEYSNLVLSNTGITSSGPGESGFGLSSDAIEINNGETIVNINPVQISSTTGEANVFKISATGVIIGEEYSPTVKIYSGGIKFISRTNKDIPTGNGGFIDISNYATRDFVTAGLSAKQNKIPVNTVDITDIETADVTKLRTIVTNLINALSSSGLINATDGVE